MPDRLIVDLGTDGLATIGVEPGGDLYERVSQASLAWPLDADVLEDLRWYLEDYLLAPFGVGGPWPGGASPAGRVGGAGLRVGV
jgi:hypothetical protein